MKTNKNALRRSHLSRKLLLQYVLTVFVFASAFIMFLAMAWTISSRIIWQPNDMVYIILHYISENILMFAGLTILAGWAVISYYYISKPLYYLDEIVEASTQLANHSDKPIILSEAIKNVQDELNTVRENALKNALAAKEAEQRKNDLVVYLAHDLKTPLTSVIGYLSLLRDEREISAQLREKYTEIALGKAVRLENLINEFFDITRFSLTQLTLEEEIINLTRMLEQMAHEFNPVLSEKSLAWNMQLEPDVQIVCDSDKLQRVFDNLFLNAFNYSYNETKITISLTRKDNHAVVQIINRGKSIPPEKLHRIFDQFFRLDSSRSTSTGGAGLGLAIAKGIIERHGGTITAESENESVIFTVILPLSRKEIV